MGTETANDNKPKGISYFSRLKNSTGKFLSFCLIFTSVIMAAAAATLIPGLWMISLSLIFISIILIIYSVSLSRKNAAEKTNEINELRSVIEKKDLYISDFSHKIRTPLNNLPLINDLLSGLTVHDNQKELLETLISSTNNMISALNELTMRSAGEISIVPRSNIRFDLRKTIDNTIELLDVESSGNIDLDISWDENLKKEYTGDPIAIKQVFIDIFNTWSSIPETDHLVVKVDVRSKLQSEMIDVVEFLIEADTSLSTSYINIDDEISETSLAGKIISLMGGRFAYEAKDERIKFSFNLPLNNVRDKNTVSAVGEKIRKLDTFSQRRKKLKDASILLVEDNITNQKIVTISLGAKVKNVDTAINGKEALDMFGKSTYDVILMDIQLPVMDGITVSNKIREIEASTSKHTPIIAITANAMIGDKEKCLSAGIDDYLSKPFQPGKLLDMISKYLSGPQT